MEIFSGKNILIVVVLVIITGIVSFNTAVLSSLKPLLIINSYNLGFPIGFAKEGLPEVVNQFLNMTSNYDVSVIFYIFNTLVWLMVIMIIIFAFMALSKKGDYEDRNFFRHP